MLFIISGAPATGKSSAVKLLKDKLENFECHDSDEIIVKTGTGRRKSNEIWIERALDAQQKGNDFLLSTQSPFGEILACPSAIKLDGIKCCLLDCNDFVRAERYLARPQFKEWPLGMDTLCWAVFHRMHAIDPQWEQRVIVDKELPEYGWNRWTNWQKGDARWEVKIIDTSENEMQYTADLVHDWILDEKKKSQILTPENKWWI
ncbi:MAG: hypothetical protein Q7J16_05125 [Candidatus Cloacimonadales bacterium]|nr:hypothetical protein [Candidatus Cloacimonadales bacterium]